jgi:DEAD/DEAH box helicase domain-containing protein
MGGNSTGGKAGKGSWDEDGMARARMVGGVYVKVEEEEDDHFSRSIDMYRGERTFIGVHKGK